ncbi:MAG: serine hydrolase [Cyclobacteriaceae bacterium]|nr:serine hydrolase [Cyclobacteriaceae bacterium]
MKPLFVALFLLVSLPAFSQKLNAQFDALLKETYKPNEPGAVALVAKGGKPIYRAAFGMADMENNVAMRPEHVFEIGSITKQFTAVAVLMLMEQGKLKREDPLTKYIPDYPKGESITIHHLLTHTSGIKSYTGMEAWAKRWREDLTPLQMIDIFKNEPMDFAPGEKWSYNNSAYFILGYIIEKVSGMPYPEFLEKNIFVPLGLKNTYYGSQSKIIRNRAQGYQKQDDFARAEYLSLTQPYAAGSIMSTVDDLLTWQLAINANKLVKKETIQLAYTPVKLNSGEVHDYGYGWGIGAINGSATIEHSGGIFGYSTNEIYLPKEDIYVVVLANCDCRGPVDVSTRMAAAAIGKPYPDAVAKVPLDPTYAQSLAGTYDFDDGSTRIVTAEGDQLFSQRAGGSRFKIFPQSKTLFSFETGFTVLEFTLEGGKVKEVVFKDRSGKPIRGKKSDKPVSSRVEVAVSPAVLQRYVGTYELMPNFNLVITLEDGHLMSQASGQPKFELFGESETKFFLKVVDAQVEFLPNAGGQFDLVVYQAGQKLAGKRK